MQNVLDTFFNVQQMLAALPQLLRVGLPNTLLLTAASFTLAVILGLLLSMALVSKFWWLRTPARIWVDIWRGLPAILSILIIGGGLPLAGFDIFGRSTYAYAITALGIINGAFLAETFRSGIQSVEVGQTEAARSLGISGAKTMALFIVPQGLRRVMPAAMNQFIICLKETALIYILGLVATRRELFSIGHDAAAANGNYSVMVAAGILFLAITIPTTYLVNAWDRSLREGRRPRDVDDQPAAPAPLTKVS